MKAHDNQRTVGVWLDNRMCVGLLLCFLFSFTMFFVSCSKEEHIKVKSTQLHGLWKKSNTQEFWRFKEDNTGVTWDEAEDVSEEESNMTFEWSIAHGDELTCIFRGEMGNQAVPKLYVIKEISETKMKWEDYYGITYVYVKVENSR